MAAANNRTYPTGIPAVLHLVPLLIGLEGPPGGGKTKSALRLADGMKRVRGGPVVLIDTEGGRSLKYAKGPHNPNGHEFMHVDFQAPFKPEDFLGMIRAQLSLKPSAIIVDSMSDEHEGDGGVLDWHDECVPLFGGNDYAAWGPPKKSRRKLIAGFQQIRTPLIFTFRAREKTEQQEVTRGGRTRNEPVKIGFQPIAPLEIVHALDLVGLLPPRADGVPVWKSPKGAEDFMLKYPDFLQPHIRAGALSEETGEALARWAMGGSAPAKVTTKVTTEDAERSEPRQDVGGPIAATTASKEMREWLEDMGDRIDGWQDSGYALKSYFESPAVLPKRKRLHDEDAAAATALKARCAAKITELTKEPEG